MNYERLDRRQIVFSQRSIVIAQDPPQMALLVSLNDKCMIVAAAPVDNQPAETFIQGMFN
jgi:hypothetical protein